MPDISRVTWLVSPLVARVYALRVLVDRTGSGYRFGVARPRRVSVVPALYGREVSVITLPSSSCATRRTGSGNSALPVMSGRDTTPRK